MSSPVSVTNKQGKARAETNRSNDQGKENCQSTRILDDFHQYNKGCGKRDGQLNDVKILPKELFRSGFHLWLVAFGRI
jgi:hypothetical protein